MLRQCDFTVNRSISRCFLQTKGDQIRQEINHSCRETTETRGLKQSRVCNVIKPPTLLPVEPLHSEKNLPTRPVCRCVNLLTKSGGAERGTGPPGHRDRVQMR
ncbi:hypothetical protein ABVT39_022119 [Epinephelus coioides]